MEELSLNKQSRKSFLQKTAMAATLLTAGQFPFTAFAAAKEVHLTLLHTNDVHSRIDPFPMDGGKYQGRAGIARRFTLIQQIRSAVPNVLLLDAGDIFQGTPYFNIFGGELEFKLMSKLKYDAATMGNHDFDNGMEGFLKQLPHAEFPFLTANYDFTQTILNDKTKRYKIFHKQGVKIGVFGLGVELAGLVDKRMYGNTIYLDPIETGNAVAAELKAKGCALVICLSHLGYTYDNDKVSDLILAKSTNNIDVIIGGHTHTFLPKPELVKNKEGKNVVVNQVGYAGINLGRLDFTFQRGKKSDTYIAALKTTKNSTILV